MLSPNTCANTELQNQQHTSVPVPVYSGFLSHMAKFTWDQVDVLACLEVSPTVDEENVSLHYDMRRDGWRIQLTIFASDRDLHLVLQRDEQSEPFLDFWMRAIAEIRYNRRAATEELLFLSSTDDHDRPNLPFGFILQVSPQVLVRLGDSLGGGRLTCR